MPVKGGDLPTREIADLVPVARPPDVEGCPTTVAVDRVGFDEREANAPPLGGAPQPDEFADRHERDLVLGVAGPITGGEQEAIGDAVADPAQMREVGVDGGFRGSGGQAASS
jgi:hypothetical protein